MTRWHEAWHPGGRSARQLRHARVKLLGSLLIIGVVVLALVAGLL